MSEDSVLKDIQSMKVVDIKKELQKRGLALSGNKPDLVERLSKSLLEEADLPSPDGDGEVDLQDEKEILGDSTFFNASKDEDDSTASDKMSDEDEEAAAATVPVKEDRLKITQPEETDEKVPAKDTASSQGERLLARSQRFGTSTETDKKKQRAERFGLSDTDASKNGGESALKDSNSGTVNLDKLKQRADRFGTSSLTPNKVPADEDERIKKRKERFGEVVASEPAAKKLAVNNNTITFSKSPSTDLMKKRAERFGL